tara:strand:+ start:461 stop:706 length:246 start_codon:yes stop_codon:yes gene_type:complete
MAKENKKMEGAAPQSDLNKANALAALQTLANFALQLAQQQSQEVHNAAGVLERVIHDATETWSSEPTLGTEDKIVKADDRD